MKVNVELTGEQATTVLRYLKGLNQTQGVLNTVAVLNTSIEDYTQQVFEHLGKRSPADVASLLVKAMHRSLDDTAEKVYVTARLAQYVEQLLLECPAESCGDKLTPDSLVTLKNGEVKKVKDLVVGDSLLAVAPDGITQVVATVTESPCVNSSVQQGVPSEDLKKEITLSANTTLREVSEKTGISVQELQGLLRHPAGRVPEDTILHPYDVKKIVQAYDFRFNFASSCPQGTQSPQFEEDSEPEEDSELEEDSEMEDEDSELDTDDEALVITHALNPDTDQYHPVNPPQSH